MKKLNYLFIFIALAIILAGCASGQKEEVASEQKETTEVTQDLPDWQYVGYKIVHHMSLQLKHIDEIGFNTFDHPKIANYESFVITPALDHFYSKAVADLRNGPVVVNTPARDDRYSSLEVFDMEHHAIFAEVTGPEAQQYVIAHVNYDGELPEGKAVIRTNSMYPFVFLRTQSFDIEGEEKADNIRRQASIEGTVSDPDKVNLESTTDIIQYVIDNSIPYPQTEALMAEAAEKYTPEIHEATFESIKAFMQAGGVSGNVGMFEAVDDPAGGSHKFRASGTLLGHLGFPVRHAYYQQIPVNSEGTRLAGANGSFSITVPFTPGVDLFWSVTRYGANTFLPLDPATIGGNNIQAYNAFNTKPDENDNVTFTFSKEDPKDGTYWMPVTDEGYYLIFRYYGPNPKLNGNTAKDIVYKGTALEKKFETVKF
ncbi:DUF1254 domain-containing protein [Bacteroidota bacterium]